jgi:hypothetical protein
MSFFILIIYIPVTFVLILITYIIFFFILIVALIPAATMRGATAFTGQATPAFGVHGTKPTSV